MRAEGVAIVGAKRIRLHTFSLLLIERGQNHEIRSVGKTNLATLNIYVPPGCLTNGEELSVAKPKYSLQ